MPTRLSDHLTTTFTGPQGPQGATGPQGPQGPSSMSDGTAAAPGLPFAANIETGFYRPAANTLGFVTASAERVRIDSSGNVGIGTSGIAIMDKLHVYENASYVGIRVQNQSNSFLTTFVHDGLGGHGFIYKGGNLDTVFYNNDVETARVKAGGNFQMNSGYGSVATAFGCRAWVNFNGTGTVAIRASGNVSSIADYGTGDFGINFSTALVDSNYSIVGASIKGAGGPTGSNSAVVTMGEGPSTTSTGVGVLNVDGTAVDRAYIYAAVIR